MKKLLALNTLMAALAYFSFIQLPAFADPQTNCWLTTYAGQYARIYTNDAMKSAGTTLTTWSNGSETQANPAYCGIQEIYSSSNWVYVRSTGLASYKMGPWQNGSFPNLPLNQKTLYRFPRTNAVPGTKTANGGGQIGIFVDGVAMFNSWDAFTWDPSTGSDQPNYSGYWNRDAYVNEGATFDPGYAHQQNTGVYHYHADPIALRYLLGDHVDYNFASKTYSESTNSPTQHSPILAWTADGFPLYGPYGYSNPTNPASGVRRMVSGYILRNGQDGTANLATTGRTSIPQWAVRLYGVSASQSGPAVSSSYPLDRYMEDNDYLGDCTNAATGSSYQQGVDFDLDQYNGRWCITPDFPNGTYAYFVAIDSNGVPVFPYNIGRGYYGSPGGGAVTSISETVVTNFLGYTNLPSLLNPPVVQNGAVTLTWSALEGGSYTVQSTTNLAPASWSAIATSVSPDQITGAYTHPSSVTQGFYRVARTAVAAYDSAGATIFGSGGSSGGNSILSVSPTSGNPGTSFTLSINLDPSVNPPPANAPINSVTIGTITGANNVHVSQTEVTSTITIPANATPGAQTVSVIFPGPPTNPSQTVTYTLTGGFTIN
jgi:hypothetical protein